MNEPETTELSVSFTDPSGNSRALGKGLIDETGLIEITEPVPAETSFVTGIVKDLNAREDVRIKIAVSNPDGGRARIQKRVVRREDDGFLSALQDYAARLYGVTLTFDLGAIEPEIEEDEINDEPEDLIGDGLDPDLAPIVADIPDIDDDEGLPIE